MVEGLAVGLSAAGKSLSTHGKEGGAEDVQNYYAQKQQMQQSATAAAQAQGFTRFELMGTLTGVAFYRALGYEAGEMVFYPATPDVMIEFVPMCKTIDQ